MEAIKIKLGKMFYVEQQPIFMWTISCHECKHSRMTSVFFPLKQIEKNYFPRFSSGLKNCIFAVVFSLVACMQSEYCLRTPHIFLIERFVPCHFPENHDIFKN